MKADKKRPKPQKIREQEFIDSFDEEMMEEFGDVFEADDTSFYNMYQQIERDRSLRRDQLFD